MARPHRCDVPGCPHTRRRWQRLCERCWAALPGDIRTGILDAHRDGRKPDWRRECKRAAEHLFGHAAAVAPHARTTPQQAYAAQQRLLGEHD